MFYRLSYLVPADNDKMINIINTEQNFDPSNVIFPELTTDFMALFIKLIHISHFQNNTEMCAM